MEFYLDFEKVLMINLQINSKLPTTLKEAYNNTLLDIIIENYRIVLKRISN